MARKKKIKETDEYDVEFNDDTIIGSEQKITKTVQAGTGGEALRKATQGDHKAINTDSVTLTKKDPSSMVATEGKGKSKSKTKRRSKPSMVDSDTMEYIETVSFPYSIMLPAPFKSLMEKVVNKKDNTVISENNGKVYLRVQDKIAMGSMLEGLYKSKDKKSKIVIDGIKGSIR